MQNALDNKLLLQAFQVLRENGQADPQGRYTLDGLWAASDMDGYHISLGDNEITVDLGFHNSYRCEGTEQQLEAFQKRLKGLLQRYQSAASDNT